MQANDMPSCPDWKKLVAILVDEMYICEDLVYDKHSGKLIGFTSLGVISDQLLSSKTGAEGDCDNQHKLAKTMMVFMVRGLFSSLWFPYVQLPCACITGDLIFHPFWHTVFRLERMEFKV